MLFDGLGNEYTRFYTTEILNNIKLLQENDFRPGAVMVVNQRNVSKLVEEYHYFDSMNIGMKLNPMFKDGAAEKSSDLDLDPDEYVSNFVAFFKYWTTDKRGHINVSTCVELVNLILNEHTGVCSFNSCLNNWLCLDSDGNIYPCDRLCTLEYLLGNVSNISSISHVFDSVAFTNLLRTSVQRRERCMSICEYYKNAILGQNDKYENGMACYIHKEVLKRIKDYVFETVISEQEFNPQYKKVLQKAIVK